MPLETGTTIADLNALWPLGQDEKSQGDDHLRLIKSIMQSDAASLAGGGTFAGPVDFQVSPTAPDGATGKEVPNADDIPSLAGTGPAEIVNNLAAGNGYLIVGDTLINWGRDGSNSVSTISFAQAYETGIPPRVVAQTEGGVSRSVGVDQVTEADFRASRFVSSNDTPTAIPVFWIAVGVCPVDLRLPKTVQTVGPAPDAPQNGNLYGRKDGAWETVTQENHDGTGVASYRIIGNTLECWGFAPGTANNVTITLPKTYLRADYSIQVIDASGGTGDMGVDNLTTTDFLSICANSRDRRWYTIGEWDGVS